MKNIAIHEKSTPFSHVPGTHFLFPGTTVSFKIFPTRLQIIDNSSASKEIKVIELSIEGPISDFTVIQKIEKQQLIVFGNSQNGYFRYCIHTDHQGQIFLSLQKAPDNRLFIDQVALNIDESVKIAHTSALQNPKTSLRLSLGSHKQQDIQEIIKRKSLIEIFPLWLALGKSIPDLPYNAHINDKPSLLKCAIEAVFSKDCSANDACEEFFKLYSAAFDNSFMPQPFDSKYQGFKYQPLPLDSEISSLHILSSGSHALLSFFIQLLQDNHVYLLPKLPSLFHSGKIINYTLPAIGTLSFEWSKKQLRRVEIFTNHQPATLYFHVQKQLKMFRLRTSKQDRGIRLHAHLPLHMEANTLYLLDNFCK